MPDEEKKEEEYTIIPDPALGAPPPRRLVAIPLGSFAGMSMSPCSLEMCLDKHFSSTAGILKFNDYMLKKGALKLYSFFLSTDVSRVHPEIPRTVEHLHELERKMHEYQETTVDPLVIEIGQKYFVGKTTCEVFELVWGLIAMLGMNLEPTGQGAAKHA